MISVVCIGPTGGLLLPKDPFPDTISREVYLTVFLIFRNSYLLIDAVAIDSTFSIKVVFHVFPYILSSVFENGCHFRKVIFQVFRCVNGHRI